MGKIVSPSVVIIDGCDREKRGITISNQKKIAEIESIIRFGAGTDLSFYLDYLNNENQ